MFPRFMLLLSLAVGLMFGVHGPQPAVAAPDVTGAGLPTALVLGDADNGFEAANVVATLGELEVVVERRTGSLGPDDDLGIGWDHDAELAKLLQYQSVWYVEAYEGLERKEQDLLVEYVNAGGNLYLTGERPCCEELNESVTDVLNRLLRVKVTVGGLGDIDGPFAFNGDARGRVASQPNLLVDFLPDSPGGMRIQGLEGVRGPNVFASSDSVIVGGVWDETDMVSGKGRVVVLMDIDWLGYESRKPILENIANYLSAGGLCSDEPDRGLRWSGGPAGCSTVTSGTYTWEATVNSGGGPYFEAESLDGVVHKCAYTLRPPKATFTCDVSVTGGGANEWMSPTLVVRATALEPGRQIVRVVKVRPKNDARNVPSGRSLDSNWWDWPDSDKDGLPDKWETDGVWVNNRFLDLPALGADKDHKDLFVRYDYQAGYKPAEKTLQYLVEMFAAAPLPNPKGGSGIALHIEVGNSVPGSVVGGAMDYLNAATVQRVGTYTGFFSSPGYGGGGVPMIYKSILNVKDPGTRIIGEAWLSGQFAWTGWDLDATYALRNVDLGPRRWGENAKARAAAFAHASNAAHELGHLLGLKHHNHEDEPKEDRKYRSVMSYSYNNFGFVRDGRNVIDYSRDEPLKDWRLNEGEFGSISFLVGQHGELADSFYMRQPDQEVPLYGEPVEELTLDEQTRAADPEAVRAWFEEFEVPVEPAIPTLEGATATVRGGESVAIALRGHDPEGGTLGYVVSEEPVVGSAKATSKGITYEAPAGYTGTVKIRVRANNESFGSEPAEVRVEVTPARFQRKGAPVVQGTATVGQKLTVKQVWTPTPEAVAVQWLRGGKPIKGATSASYTLTADDAGKAVSARLTATRGGFEPDVVISAPQTVSAKSEFSVTAIAVTGSARVGKKLGTKGGKFSIAPSKKTYQWYADGKAVAGATGSTYKVAKVDAGKALTVKITGTLAGYPNATATSAPIRVAAANVKKPIVSGSKKVGKVLKAKKGTWLAPGHKFSYQWFRNGKAVKGATKSSYKLVKKDAGAKVLVKVTAKKSGFPKVTAGSKAAKIR